MERRVAARCAAIVREGLRPIVLRPVDSRLRGPCSVAERRRRPISAICASPCPTSCRLSCACWPASGRRTWNCIISLGHEPDLDGAAGAARRAVRGARARLCLDLPAACPGRRGMAAIAASRTWRRARPASPIMGGTWRRTISVAALRERSARVPRRRRAGRGALAGRRGAARAGIFPAWPPRSCRWKTTGGAAGARRSRRARSRAGLRGGRDRRREGLRRAAWRGARCGAAAAAARFRRGRPHHRRSAPARDGAGLHHRRRTGRTKRRN